MGSSRLLRSRVLTALAVACVLVVGVSATATATAAEPPRSLASARLDALAFMDRVRPDGPFSEWRSAMVDDGTAFYDASGTVDAYVFSVELGGLDDGYVTVAADPDRSNPVLEFSHRPSPVVGAPVGSAGPESASSRLYLGPLDYEVRSSGAPHPASLMALGASSTTSVAQASTATRGESASTVAALGSRYALISGVPDRDQFKYDYTSGEYNDSSIPTASDDFATSPYLDAGSYFSGCVPTAASNIIMYWASHGYPNLVTGALPEYSPTYDPDDASPYSPARSSSAKVVNDLHVYMHTFDSSGSGATWFSDAAPGMMAYANQIGGYEFGSNMIASEPFSFFTSEIDASRPCLFAFAGLKVTGPTDTEDYGDHSITGVGYDYTPGDDSSQYMIMRDNWQTTPADVYVQYGGYGADATYDGQWMVTFVPPTPITIPDSHFEAALREAIDKPTGQLIPADLTPLVSLNAPDDSISNLTGLEAATGLQVADLEQNQISDAGVLGRMPSLYWLRISDNNLTDISSLDAATKLGYVDLTLNHLDLSAGSPASEVVQSMEERGVDVDCDPQYPLPLTINTSPDATSKTYKRKRGSAKFTLWAKLVDYRGELGGASVYLQKSGNGKSWSNLYRFTTNSTGKVTKTFMVRKKSTVYYRWVVRATSQDLATTTRACKIRVK